jgi:glycosyl transferase, family 25
MSAIGSCEVRVVHLARAAERRALMEAEFARVGVTPTAWDGVDGRAPETAARLAELPDTGPWGPVDWHAKGCLLSHLDAFHAFLNGTASHLLMFEDDVHIADDMAAWLVGSWWPSDAHLVKIERWRDDKLLIVVDRKAYHHPAGRDLRRLRSKHSGTAGYFISRSGAELVLSSSFRSVPVDHLLFNPYVSPIARQLVTYQVFPALVTQGNEPRVAPAPSSAGVASVAPRRRKPLLQKLQRLGAEIRVLRALPRLISRRAFLTSISWQASVPSLADSHATPKG